MEELFDLDVEEIMDQTFYCHRCSELGKTQELETVYYTEELPSYRPGHDKYLAVAENGCPEPEHSEVEFRITEGFYS